MAIPVPHQVRCDCELQPLRRCYVAAPFDGRLEKAFVEPGDVVRPDQLLARLDGREIRWELAAVTADIARAGKQRDGHLAAHELGPAELSRLEGERLRIRRELLEHRDRHREIRSPIEGLVISGDLRKTEGAPLSVGQPLFEIGPLDDVLIEIAIPQGDLAYVCEGQEVQLDLDALPSQSWQGTLDRIHPRSEVKDQQHVFVAEVTLPNAAGLMRPGMRGRASIAAPSRALGWVLFHKPWRKLAQWIGW